MAEEKDEPEQLAIMRQMLELAEKQLEQSRVRTRLSEERSRMSADRSRMSEDRSRMSADRSRMSADRSEKSETRSYHNAERTLSVWVRTALSLMVFGIAIDRFGLLLHRLPARSDLAIGRNGALLESMSSWVGAALLLLAVFMSLSTALRFLAYARTWRRQHTLPPHHGPYLATFFALATAAFGVLLLVMMLVYAG